MSSGGVHGWIRRVYPPERQQAIAEFLVEQADHRAGVVQIGERLGVTTETVRKDLDVLERRGVLRRVRGGAELLSTTPFEQALAARHAEQLDDKITIARRVVAELPEDGVVILDSGSLTFVCAQLMPTDRPITLVTNNLPAARFLAGRTRMTIMTLPGSVRGLTSAAVDSWTTHRLESITADLAIIGVNGLTAERGLMTTNPEEASVKRAMLLAARRRLVPVISGKLGRTSFCAFAAVSEIDLVITDSNAPPEQVAALSGGGPAVVLA